MESEKFRLILSLLPKEDLEKISFLVWAELMDRENIIVEEMETA
jgi:hypothetical protein